MSDTTIAKYGGVNPDQPPPGPPGRWGGDRNELPQQLRDIYYPFRETLFRRPLYKGLKYGNMGIARSLHWRKGFPVIKMGRFAGTFRTSGRKNKQHQTKYFKKLRERRAKRCKVEKQFITDVIRETVGWAPYEKRCMELLKQGNPKKALKFVKKRV